jgi:hypothetical protein
MGRVGGAYAYWLLTVGIASLLGVSQVTLFRSGSVPNIVFLLSVEALIEADPKEFSFGTFYVFFSLSLFSLCGSTS